MRRSLVGLLGGALGLFAADPASALTYWYQGNNTSSVPQVLVNAGHPATYTYGPGDYVSYGTANDMSAGTPNWVDSFSKPKLSYGFANCDTSAGHAGFCHSAHDTALATWNGSGWTGKNAWAGGQSLYMNAYTKLSSSNVTDGAGYLCYNAQGQGTAVEVCAQFWGGFVQPVALCSPRTGVGATQHWLRFNQSGGYFTVQSGSYLGQVASFGYTNFAVSVSPSQLYTAVAACNPGLVFDYNAWQLLEVQRGFEAGGYSNSSLKAEDDLSQESVLSK